MEFARVLVRYSRFWCRRCTGHVLCNKSSSLPWHPQLSSSTRHNRNIVRPSGDDGCRNSSKQIVFGVWPISSPLKILEKMSRLKNSEANESAASVQPGGSAELQDRKSTRLNSSH